MEIVRDLRIGNAILRKMSKENNFDIENVYINNYFKYIHTIDVHKPDADFCQTEYKGNKYRVEYISGCFYPFITKI